MPPTLNALTKLRELPRTLAHMLSHPLNRGRPVNALLRFLRWQVGSRLVPGPVAVPLADGVRILAAPGMPGATGAVYLGLHEFSDMAFVLHYLRPGDLFVDAGANVGSYTLLAASTGARCISFEPVPQTHEKLLTNVRLNGFLERVEAVNACLGARAGVVLFTIDIDTENHVTRDGYAGATLEVPILTLDDVLSGKHATIVKVDVEGYETEVIRGATSLLQDRPPDAFVVEINDASHRYGSSEDAFLSILGQFGYRPHDYDAFERRLLPLGSVSTTSNNTIFTRNAERLAHRLQSAPVRKILGRTF